MAGYEGVDVVSVVLAAGYGTRLHSSILADDSSCFDYLAATPKPLLPLGGSTICERWLDIFSSAMKEYSTGSLSSTLPVVITNKAHYHEYASAIPHLAEGAIDHNQQKEKLPRCRLVCDGSSTNEERLGATVDLRMALSHACQPAGYGLDLARHSLQDVFSLHPACNTVHLIALSYF